ncbi:MAG: HAD-IA family hydrolase [Candidatus Omnitrophica bacterium]|nr:HAD-IA family hydrolase [Candidatus Omnitrophota bacterium]
MKHRVELIFFDLDGTLADTKANIVASVNYTLKTLGAPARPADEIVRYIGVGADHLIIKSLGEAHIHKFHEAEKIILKYTAEHISDNVRLFAHVKETLEYFTKKRKILLSNRQKHLCELLLKSLGIAHHFEEVIGGDDPACRKPSACPLNNMIKKHLKARDGSIIVGDMAVDIQAGKAAGILTCAVTYGGIGSIEEVIAAKPDYVIDDMLKLKDIIE